jgi:cell division protein FtsI (penicillin-binding protein 3)
LAAEGVVSRLVHTGEPAQRGDIVSVDGTVLATDVPRYTIEANPREIAKFERKAASGRVLAKAAGAAELLAPVIGWDEAELREALDTDGTWVPLVPDASPALTRQIVELNVTGVFANLYYQRSYPAGAVAGNIVGYPYMGDEDEDHPDHYTGLELTQDKLLRGTPGERTVEVGGGGQPIPGGQASGTPAVTGCEITLTIDSDLQWEALNAIDRQVSDFGADSGLVVAIDIKSGEILAIADSGTVNPLEAQEQGLAGGSRAVQDIFEPGSTGKVVTMAMVLETGEATPGTTYAVPWTATFGGQEFKDHAEHGVMNWTLNDVLGQSSNIGTLMAAQNIADQTRYDYLAKFGFGEATGVELPSENPGILHVPGTQWWDGRTRNTVLFGQGVAVNGLQAAGVYQIVGNAGVAMPLHLIRGWQCPDGTSGAPSLGQGTRVISEETASTLIGMLESAVDEGTGGPAKITGYRVAGKTGTSEMIGKDGTADYFVSSFIGVAPADDPRVAVAVIVNGAQSSSWGAVVAAPVFKKVASFALQRLDVPPSTSEPIKMPTTSQ